ncbi:uncharacterized protein LOC135845420 [Planococcus citri]|uniref:uncharacterized protein LOC135845420 n=1 Tax=Planococcus citri TaxID=170843 RepID=UPI0031F9FCD2
MKFVVMKSVLVLVYGLVFFESFAFEDLNSTDDNRIVGVSEKNLEEYMTKVFNGFKNVILKGDEEMNYPIMEPYKLEDFSWDWSDTSGSNKYSMKFLSVNQPVVKGLSNCQIRSMQVSAKDMTLAFDIGFSDLQIEIPYKLDGYLLKGFMPVYGEGVLKLSSPDKEFYIIIDLDMEKGFIMVENFRLISYSYYDEINVKVTGLMDLPDKFASYVLDDILGSSKVETEGLKALENIMLDRIEATIGGMTMDELFDYLGHFERKIQ